MSAPPVAGKPIVVGPAEAKRVQVFFLFASIPRHSSEPNFEFKGTFPPAVVAEISCKDQARRDLRTTSTIFGSIYGGPENVLRADVLKGRVVAVADGDTLIIETNNEKVRIRLAEIDAPELRQSHGGQAKQSLEEICVAKPVEAVWFRPDRYSRTLARVQCADIDANTEQVRRGMAWVFAKDAPAHLALFGLEAEARRAKRGLWAEPKPVAPWEWRAANVASDPLTPRYAIRVKPLKRRAWCSYCVRTSPDAPAAKRRCRL